MRKRNYSSVPSYSQLTFQLKVGEVNTMKCQSKETEHGDSTIRRVLTELEDTGRKVKGSNPAEGKTFFHSKSPLNICQFHLTSTEQ